MLKKFIRIVGGDPQKKEIEKNSEIVKQINAIEPEFEQLTNQELSSKTTQFIERLNQGETLDDLLIEAFAVVREASKRTIGLRHYDVQLIGGITLHQGKIAEMRTGEGKTLVATLALYLNALSKKGTHLITVNDYLARRDARWMAPIFNLLGLSVGVLQMAARTESGKKAFIVDLQRESPHEDQNQLVMVTRRQAYQADILYGTNSEFGFDYLRDNMTMSLYDRVQRGHNFAIIDEVDNVLIDEARTPLIISGPAHDEAEWYIRMAEIVKKLRVEDYEIDEKGKSITLTELGEVHVEELLDMSLRDPERPEDVTPEQARILGYLEQALRAQYIFKRNKDYLVQSGKVVIVDEFTGRLMPGRRWSDGLHQAIEAKENVRVQSESVTYATITIQNYFRMYDKLSGMTGTAVTESEEFHKIYNLDVLAIPTNLEYLAQLPDSDLLELEDRDPDGYKYTYYARSDDGNAPVYWKRKDYPDVVYRTQEAKLRSIAKEILTYHIMGRPILVGTTSVELSELVSSRLETELIKRLIFVLLLRKVWIDKNNIIEDGRSIEELKFLNQPLDKLKVNDLRPLAKQLEITTNLKDDKTVDLILNMLKLDQSHRDRLLKVLDGGIRHEVLNAKKHTEESQIIAGAGAFGSVTIATNMAGRGVDIKLGGEIAEEILSTVNRILSRAGYEDPFSMTLQERREALLELDPSEFGIYESEIKYFLNYMKEAELVRELGGLHVIGSERHEARRIDNQLRGRAARQGDPGSSRFYLSMEDELMRLFGGQQADALMQRLKIDDALPLELGLVGRLVEQSQSRVEGANFDVRKHLLEYDDVLNTQRASIYNQRDRIFTKDDLTEDVIDILRTEITRRVPEALVDDSGPWKLLAWLEQIQPTFSFEDTIFPSYPLELLIDEVKQRLPDKLDVQAYIQALISIAEDAFEAEKEHQLIVISNQLDSTYDTTEDLILERYEKLDIYLDNLSNEKDYDEVDRVNTSELLNELMSLLQVQIRLSASEIGLLKDDPYSIEAEIKDQIKNNITQRVVKRVIGAIERKFGESLAIKSALIEASDWFGIRKEILISSRRIYDNRAARLFGANGLITKDLTNAINRFNDALDDQSIIRFLSIIPQGSVTTFDKKTHKRVVRHTTRLSYNYLVAKLIDQNEPDIISERVLSHLERAQKTMSQFLGDLRFSQFSNFKLDDLDEITKKSILRIFTENRIEPQQEIGLCDYSKDVQSLLTEKLGKIEQTKVYRRLLLSVITEQWVEYLTRMEALRVSIGLEAYAQRDPLVQYKNRAYELFQEFLDNMRTGIVYRMFTIRPTQSQDSQTPPSVSNQSKTTAQEQSLESSYPVSEDRQKEKEQPKSEEVKTSKRRRHRRRK